MITTNSNLGNFANDNTLYASSQKLAEILNIFYIVILKKLQNGFMKTIWC